MLEKNYVSVKKKDEERKEIMLFYVLIVKTKNYKTKVTDDYFVLATYQFAIVVLTISTVLYVVQIISGFLAQ